MAKYIACTNPHISLDELVNSLLVQDTSGNVGLRIVRTSEAAANIIDVKACGNPNMSMEDVIRNAIVADSEGKPALMLVEST